MSTSHRLLREPLLHFVALGVLIFGADRALAGPAEADAEPQRLEVSAEMIERLAARHQEQTGQRPDAATRRALVDELVRGEVLQRQARSLGLDRGDLVVQRRLAQKMEFLLESQAAVDPPNDEELRAWRDAHPERYRRRDRVHFEHRLFGADRRGAAASQDAREALARLLADPREAAALGDPSTHGAELTLDPAGIERRFGSGFAAAVQRLPPGSWQGPIDSRYGAHLVRVLEVRPGELPDVAELRARLREDLVRHRRRQAREAAIEALMAEVELVLPADAFEGEVAS